MAHTVSVNVDAAGVSFSVIISVCLKRVAIKGTVITAVADPISVRVKLPRVVHQRAIVLCQTHTFVHAYGSRKDVNICLFQPARQDITLARLTFLHLHAHCLTFTSGGRGVSE